MSVDIQFGNARIFEFYVVGQIYTTEPVSKDVGDNILALVREALNLHFAPSNRSFGVKPTVMEIIKVVENGTGDGKIKAFDPGSPTNNVITWRNCDPEFFNCISYARYIDLGPSANNLRISPECLIK